MHLKKRISPIPINDTGMRLPPVELMENEVAASKPKALDGRKRTDWDASQTSKWPSVYPVIFGPNRPILPHLVQEPVANHRRCWRKYHAVSISFSNQITLTDFGLLVPGGLATCATRSSGERMRQEQLFPLRTARAAAAVIEERPCGDLPPAHEISGQMSLPSID
jgi:hypothetical protein